jgi:hypothetical protein
VIPIVIGVGGDPVTSGFVASLARPGGNVMAMPIGDMSRGSRPNIARRNRGDTRPKDDSHKNRRILGPSMHLLAVRRPVANHNAKARNAILPDRAGRERRSPRVGPRSQGAELLLPAAVVVAQPQGQQHEPATALPK